MLPSLGVRQGLAAVARWTVGWVSEAPPILTFALRKCALDPEVDALIEKAALLWRDSAYREKPSEEILCGWDKLLDEWMSQTSMPILIRKAGQTRGKLIEHSSSARNFVLTDNSPAHWAFSLALDKQVPTLQEVGTALEAGTLGVALAFRPGERDQADYKGTLKAFKNLQKWNICHIDNVSDSFKGKTESQDIDKLLRHSIRFLSPRNMFVVPRKSRLGEIPAFISVFAKMNTKFLA
jgi:hypothetical protein